MATKCSKKFTKRGVSKEHFYEPDDCCHCEQNLHRAKRQVEMEINVAQSAVKKIEKHKHDKYNPDEQQTNIIS